MGCSLRFQMNGTRQSNNTLTTCSGRARRPMISMNRRGAADAATSATIAAFGLLARTNTAIGTSTAPLMASVVLAAASGQTRRAIAVIRNRTGVGLGIDAYEEPVFIRFKYVNIIIPA